MKESASQLALNLSASSSHLAKVKYLTDLQAKLVREEGRTRECLMDIQRKLNPHMDTIQARIAHAKTLVQNIRFSSAETLIELSREVQVEFTSLRFCSRNGIVLYPKI